MPHTMAGFCHVCGRPIAARAPRAWVGMRICCPPVGSPCHELGLRSAGWTISATEAAALAAADAAAYAG